MARKVALSFSGGKDSCLALYELKQLDIEVACLLTTVWEESLESVAHGEELGQLERQAHQLGIPIHFIKTTFDTYAEDFMNTLRHVKKIYGLDGVAFGDIYIKGHRDWGEELAAKVQLKPMYPLWSKREHVLEMLQQFVDLGFQAKVIKIDEEKLPTSWVGRQIDSSFINDIVKYDAVCPMGESGEYHTTVFAGPIFKK